MTGVKPPERDENMKEESQEAVTQKMDQLNRSHPILQFFQTEHLPPNLQSVSRLFQRLAYQLADDLPPGAEKAVALRKLLEGKDAAVRAVVGEIRNS